MNEKMKRNVFLVMGGFVSIFVAFCFAIVADVGSSYLTSFLIMILFILTETFIVGLTLAEGDLNLMKKTTKQIFHHARRRKNDEANSAPVAFLLVAVAVFGFETIIFGGDLVESSIYATLTFNDCSNEGFFDTAACVLTNVAKGIANTVLIVASVVRFLFNALTFNVPGAPIVVRVLFGAAFTAGVGWPIANLIRGSSA